MLFENIHPIIREWFHERFAAPTEAQRLGWPAIQTRQRYADRRADRLGQDAHRVSGQPRSAPATGSGGRASRSDLRRVRFAAAGTVERHSAQSARARWRNCSSWPAREHPDCPEIRAAVRTGDTPASERQRMVRRPPHILVTTPESLYLVLTGSAEPRDSAARRNRHRRRNPRRGPRQARLSHLALSLERLDALCARRGPCASACRRRRSRSRNSPAFWSGSERAVPASRGHRPLPRHGPGGRSAADGAASRLHARALGRGLRTARRTDRASTRAR